MFMRQMLTETEKTDNLSASAGDDKIAWYENQGDGTFSDQKIITTNADGARSVYARDLYGDSRSDVLFASFNDSKIAWYENTDSSLPVELASFDATTDGNKVHLTWTTASETGNTRFEVQRRALGAEAFETQRAQGQSRWKTVGSVEGSGTMTEAQSYRFTDKNPPYQAGRLAYRLRQVDVDGTAHYTRKTTVQRRGT